MSKDQNIQERAETVYPYHNDPASDPQQHLLQNAYIKGATKERELMSNQWVSVETPPEPGIRVRAIRQYGNGKQEEIHTVWVKRLDCFDDLLTDIITHWQYVVLPSPVIKKG